MSLAPAVILDILWAARLLRAEAELVREAHVQPDGSFGEEHEGKETFDEFTACAGQLEKIAEMFRA